MSSVLTDWPFPLNYRLLLDILSARLNTISAERSRDIHMAVQAVP
jgi:hypothetical protein